MSDNQIGFQLASAGATVATLSGLTLWPPPDNVWVVIPQDAWDRLEWLSAWAGSWEDLNNATFNPVADVVVTEFERVPGSEPVTYRPVG